MLAFEILVNGKKICVPGAGRALSTVISWEEHEPHQIRFYVGGVPTDADELLEWNTPRVGVGDEITVRIVEIDSPDPPDQAHKGYPDIGA